MNCTACHGHGEPLPHVDNGETSTLCHFGRQGSVIKAHGILEIAREGFGILRNPKYSFAPFPDDAHSLGNAVERMGIPKIGMHGSLAAAAILTETIDRADFPHTGFSGFMQPLA